MKAVRYTPAMIRKYTDLGFWTTETMVDVWEKNAVAFPGEEAIADQARRLSRTAAVSEIETLVRWVISLGIGRDEVVVGQLPNVIEAVTFRVAMEKAGVIYLPGIMTWREKEMEYIARTLKAAAVVGPRSYDGLDFEGMYRGMAATLPTLRRLILWGGPGVLEAEDPAGPGRPSVSFEGRDRERLKHPGENPLTLILSRQGRGEQAQTAPGLTGRLEDRTFRSLETSGVSTSTGTTGMPKLVESATAPTLLFGKVVAQRLAITSRDIVASIGPVNWGPGVGAVYSGAAQRRARIVLLEKFDPEKALDLIETEKVTVAAGSTAQLVAMVRSPAFDRRKLKTMRAFYWAGAPLSYAIAREAEEKADCVLVGAYGAMDAGYFACSSVGDSPVVRNLTVGKPLDGNDAIIVDADGRRLPVGEVGEIWFRGANCFPGFFRDEAATRQAWGKMGLAGWFRTGDVGQMDGEGNLRVLGRMKDVLYAGGQPVYPAEIENALLSHPGVLSAAVVGAPGPAGHAPVAFVVPRSGVSFSYEGMVDYLKSRGLAEHKMPARLVIRESFPMSGDGLKISRKDLELEAAGLLRSP